MELVGVRHRHRGVGEVLAGVDLVIDPGRPVVVTGGNGSGKSTLLRIAAGGLRPRSGAVHGRPRRVGYLPAPFPTTPRLTVRRFSGHLDALHGLRRGASLALLDALRFAGDLDGPVATLSTGNATKVGLAQALAVTDGLVVLDEPWTALDDPAAAALADLLTARTSATTLLADHTGRAAALPRASVYRLERGRLQSVSPDEPTVPVAHRAHVVVACRGPAELAVRRLPEVAGSTCSGDLLTASIAQGDVDGWLAAALAAGCSVVAVRRAP